MGFAVGLSGALMPGPLFIYTINESIVKGKWSGAYIILGHAIVEVTIFILLFLGLLSFATNPLFVKAASLAGGAAMTIMAVYSLKTVNKEISEIKKKTGYGLVVGGVIFTAFNPGFPVWWLTAGTAMLLEAFKKAGTTGMITVVVGHWGADLLWYSLISVAANKSRHLIKEKWYKTVRVMLSILLLTFGVYFLSTGI